MPYVTFTELPPPGPARVKRLKAWSASRAVSGLDLVMTQVLERTPTDREACLMAIERLTSRASSLGGLSEDVKLVAALRAFDDEAARRAADVLAGLFAAPRCFAEAAKAAAVLLRRKVATPTHARTWALAAVTACVEDTQTVPMLAQLRPFLKALKSRDLEDIEEVLSVCVPGASPSLIDGALLAAQLARKKAARTLKTPTRRLVLFEELVTGQGELWSAQVGRRVEVRWGNDAVLFSWGRPSRWSIENGLETPLDATGLAAGDASFFHGIVLEQLSEMSLELDARAVLEPARFDGARALPSAVCVDSAQKGWLSWLGRDTAGRVVAFLLVEEAAARRGAERPGVTVQVPRSAAKKLVPTWRFFSNLDRNASLATVRRRLPEAEVPRVPVWLAIESGDWLPIVQRSLQLQRGLSDVLVAMLKS